MVHERILTVVVFYLIHRRIFMVRIDIDAGRSSFLHSFIAYLTLNWRFLLSLSHTLTQHSKLHFSPSHNTTNRQYLGSNGRYYYRHAQSRHGSGVLWRYRASLDARQGFTSVVSSPSRFGTGIATTWYRHDASDPVLELNITARETCGVGRVCVLFRMDPVSSPGTNQVKQS